MRYGATEEEQPVTTLEGPFERLRLVVVDYDRINPGRACAIRLIL
jgi:hypothetical protein